MGLSATKRIVLFLAIGLILCRSASTDPVASLKEIYETPVPAEIRRNFNRIRTHTACPECAPSVFNWAEFIAICPKKFLVLDVEPNGGGVWAFIAVEGERKDTYVLWLEDAGENKFNMRSIEELPDSMDEEFVSQLENSAHGPFWL